MRVLRVLTALALFSVLSSALMAGILLLSTPTEVAAQVPPPSKPPVDTPTSEPPTTEPSPEPSEEPSAEPSEEPSLNPGPTPTARRWSKATSETPLAGW